MDRTANEKSWIAFKPRASMDVKPQTFTHEEVYIIRYLRRFLYDRQRASEGWCGRQFRQPGVWHEAHVLCAKACSGCTPQGGVCPPLSSPPSSGGAGTQRKGTVLWQKILENTCLIYTGPAESGPLFLCR